ncbi:MAG: ribonuclease III [Fusobacteria bacterium]|nr:MAG: ribonuclease III [Fusobacteriota bacterium]KAF0229991.1 MAG: ribonuclease [Fusobacteriota bacterium]
METTLECQKSLVDFGIEIKNLNMLKTALTHPTYSYENNLPENNQRLEFLGDTVLSLIIVEYLYAMYPNKQEGELSKIKSVVVSGESLAEGARKFKLYDYLLIGKGEEKVGGRYRDSVLADAFEALIAAIYLDLGFEKVKEFVFQILDDIIEEIVTKGVRDYKTILQELLQKDYKKSVEYKVLAEKGPDHDKVFTVGLIWEEQVIAIGLGKSKKEAERQGAKIAIEYFLNKG